MQSRDRECDAVRRMMRTTHLESIPLAVFAALAAGLASPHPVAAQDAPSRSPNVDAGTAADAGVSADAGAAAVAVTDDLPEGASDAERIVRIRGGIRLDKQKLRGLGIELRSRARWFEDLAAGMTEVASKLNENKEALEGLGDDADPEEIKELEQRIAELQEDYDLYNRQTDLALTAEKKTKDQIRALTTKIETDERSLAELIGDAPITEPRRAEEPARSPEST